jgi:DNA-binding MarR family transcriptional regulator
MEEKNNGKGSLQHVQLPNDMTKGTDLTPKELLIYVCIKKHQNKVTKTCYPSMDTIAELSSSSKPTVAKAIKNLERLGYIKITKDGRKNVYHFDPYKNFEPFSMEFLEMKELSANEKAYIIATQQYMFKDLEGYGKVTFTDMELADTINLSYNTVVKYNKSLMEKGYLDIIKTNARDTTTGLMINEKIFHLNELEQAIVFKLQNHEERLDKADLKIDTMAMQLDIVLRENKQIKDQLDRLQNPEKYVEIVI